MSCFRLRLALDCLTNRLSLAVWQGGHRIFLKETCVENRDGLCAFLYEGLSSYSVSEIAELVVPWGDATQTAKRLVYSLLQGLRVVQPHLCVRVVSAYGLWLQQAAKQFQDDQRLALARLTYKKQMSVWVPPLPWSRLPLKKLVLQKQTLETIDRTMRPCQGQLHALPDLETFRSFLQAQDAHVLVSDDADLLEAVAAQTCGSLHIPPMVDA